MKTRRRLLDPRRSARAIVARRRSAGNDLILATILAAIAGAANAGGFFALGQYTSHMTGYLASVADNLAIAQFRIAAIAALAVAAFIVGAAFSAMLINWARGHAGGRRQYAWPLVVQGVLLACFSLGGLLTTELGRIFSLACLCFIMGMQNATITKISGARIRTTHATGIVTDIGIELGRAVYGRIRPGAGVGADGPKLRLLLRLVAAFLSGGLFGAIGYGLAGFLFSIPLAAVLLALGLPGVIGSRAR